MKYRLWRRVVLTLLPAVVIGATTATVIGPGVASASISNFTLPAQSPSPVTAGGTATYAITIQDSDGTSGHRVKLVAGTGLPTGATFSDTTDGCVEDNSSGVYSF